jgi:Trk K+ transport system NAD-binding subunit
MVVEVSTAPAGAGDMAAELAPLEAERRALLLVAGSPALARRLAEQLPGDWQITLVSPEAHAVDADAGDERVIERVNGDPTSALVLERAGAGGARVVLAALPDPEENLEVCRGARERLLVPTVLALVPSAEAAEPFHALGVETIDAAGLVATAVRNQVERASAVAQDVGLGRGELVEIALQPNSPVIGRRLRAFRPRGWAVAAVFRGDELLLPEPETVPQADDRLLLVGQPDRLGVIAEYLRVGRARFPQPNGGTIAGVVWGAPRPVLLQEVAALAAGVGLQEIALVACGRSGDWQAATDALDRAVAVRWSKDERDPAEIVSEVLKDLSPGCLVLPPARARLPHPFAGMAAPLARALNESAVPVFIPRGTFPYERILLPVVRTPLPNGAVQAALDLSEQLHGELVTVHVRAPAFLAEHGDEAAVVTAAVDEMAAVRRREVQHERRTGNPLAELQRLAGPNRLAVFSHHRDRRWHGLRPDLSAYLAQRLAGSALVVPVDGA